MRRRLGLPLFAVLLAAAGCRGGEQGGSAPLPVLDPPALPGALGASWALVEDRPLLSWLEPAGGTPPRWRLRTASLDGAAWAPAATVAEGADFFANWADFPGVAAVSRGERRAIAHWLAVSGDDKYAYTIELAATADGGRSWALRGPLPSDRVPAEHGFVSWIADRGALRAFWLDGRGMPGGGPMTLRTARVDPAAGPAATPTAEELVDERVCDCCATDAALADSGPVVVYRDRSDGEIRDISIVRWTGSGWSVPARIHDDGWQIAGCPVNGPAVAARGRRVAVAWFTGAPAPTVKLAVSTDGGASFGAPAIVDDQAPLGRVDVALDDQGAAIVSWLGADAATPGRASVRIRREIDPRSAGAPTATAVSIGATGAVRASGFPRLLLDGDRLLVAWVETGEPERLKVTAIPTAQLGGAER